MKAPSYTTLCSILWVVSSMLMMSSCNDSEHSLIPASDTSIQDSVKQQRQLPEDFKSYWYSGKAEITSFKLMQERYGELREGTATTIFVTEDFLPDAQVKANTQSGDNTSVLKLNSVKKFTTGIYPYSIMTSTFNPIQAQQHPLKITHSVQEWCGQSYMQLNNREAFKIQSHSYFEGEADQSLSLSKTWLEDELWNRIRINPEELPTGAIQLIPSFEYIRLRHTKIKAYPATVNLKQGDSLSMYSVMYPELERELIIYFKSTFPYEIEKWSVTNGTHPNDSTRLKTTAEKMKRIRIDYWNKNKTVDERLRDSLQLN